MHDATDPTSSELGKYLDPIPNTRSPNTKLGVRYIGHPRGSNKYVCNFVCSTLVLVRANRAFPRRQPQDGDTLDFFFVLAADPRAGVVMYILLPT